MNILQIIKPTTHDHGQHELELWIYYMSKGVYLFIYLFISETFEFAGLIEEGRASYKRKLIDLIIIV
jgi:hypothetical protein